MSDAGRQLAVTEPQEDDVEERRDRDLLGRRPGENGAPNPLRKLLADLRDAVKKGFEDQVDRSDSQQDYWDCYNCEANGNRYYNGIADIYFPIIHDAVEARVTRFVNQMFPQSGRYVEVVASDGSTVSELRALLDHYVRSRQFKTQIAAPLSRNGDVEGQYNLYVDWAEVERQIVSRETRSARDPVTGVEAGTGPPIEDIKEETIREGFPVFEVLHDCDVLVLPATADTIEEALAAGGSVTIVRRWSKAKIDQLIANGTIRGDEGDALKEEMAQVAEVSKNIERHLLDHVGIRKGGKEAAVWETWHMLPLSENGSFTKKGDMRLCRSFFGPSNKLLGTKRNPYWNDRCPLLSCAVKKMSGVFKGPSLLSYVDSLQYEANDAANEGADAATLSAAPIVLRDASKGNGPLVFNVGAIWDYPADGIKLLEFPDLTPRAQTRVQLAMQAIFQTLGVNPSMLPQQTRSGKPNQAQIAQEQAVDLLTTAESVSILEEGIFTPAMGWAVDLDYQFRDKPLTVRMFGEMGKRAEMQQVEPLQNRNGLTFIWRGGNQARQSAMMQQQGIAFLNVAKDPQLQQIAAASGLKIDLAPLLTAIADNMFGPELAANLIIDQRDQLTIPQDQENEMLAAGFQVPVHPLDQDEQHIPVVMQFIQATGDPHGWGAVHLQAHLHQRQAKMQAAAMAQMAQQMQGQQRPQQGGAPRAPQPGAVPAGPRLIKGPPGTIPQDQLPRAGAMAPPRRA